MALLNTATPQPDMEEDESAISSQQPMEAEQGGQLTITADQVGKHVLDQLDPNMQQALKQAVEAGMKLLFSKETHDQIFGSIRPEDEVPLKDELGAGATNLMLLMYQKSNQTMPAEIIIPTGAVLLAKACEFINDGGIAPVTDEDYSEAFQLFTTNIQDKLNPNFRQENGIEPSQAEQPMPQQQAQPMPQSGGLLNTGGQV